jgi:hypothetical protein
MEWLVANKAADRLRANETASALISRTMSDLMLDFLCDLASHDVTRTWAATVLADTDAQGGGVPGVSVSDHAKQNALAITRRPSRVMRPRRPIRREAHAATWRESICAGRT